MFLERAFTLHYKSECVNRFKHVNKKCKFVEMSLEGVRIRNARKMVFLLDVFKLAITAFGGPQVHFTQIHKRMVLQKKYLLEEELNEINSLCQLIPGPGSTQTITAIGFKLGGAQLAYITLAIWILPATLIMTCVAILLQYFSLNASYIHAFRFLPPMAIAFISVAAFKSGKLFLKEFYQYGLAMAGAFLAISFPSPYIFPFLLIAGGIVSSYISKRRRTRIPEKPGKIPWDNFILFIGTLLIAAILGALTHNKLILLFENTYRYGSIVYGGGHVLIPMLFNQFVESKQYIQAGDFLAGVGLLQAIPGPVFSIATFSGAMIMESQGIGWMITGAAIATLGIFLPGTFLLFFVYPVWNRLKQYSPVANAVSGINAVSVGLIIAAIFFLVTQIDFHASNILVYAACILLLTTLRLPYPIVVLLCLLCGYIL